MLISYYVKATKDTDFHRLGPGHRRASRGSVRIRMIPNAS